MYRQLFKRHVSVQHNNIYHHCIFHLRLVFFRHLRCKPIVRVFVILYTYIFNMFSCSHVYRSNDKTLTRIIVIQLPTCRWSVKLIYSIIVTHDHSYENFDYPDAHVGPSSEDIDILPRDCEHST